MRRVRTIRSSTYSHPFQVTLPNPRTLSHNSPFIPRSSQIWNSLQSTIFPESYNVSSFKSYINNLDLFALSTYTSPHFEKESISKFVCFSDKIEPLIGMLFTYIDLNHLNGASFSLSYLTVLTLHWRFKEEFSKASIIFFLFFFQVASVLVGILYSLATSLFKCPFSRSFKALYFIFKVTSLYFLLDAIVGNDVKHQQTNKNTLNAFSKYSISTKRSIIEKFEFY